MIAVVINAGLIILGSLLGILLNGKLPVRFMNIVMQCLGLCVIGIGMSSAITTNDTLCVVVCLVLGSILGEAIDIERRLDTFSNFLRDKLSKGEGSTFTEGFVTASVLFCVGAMAIIGSIDAGIHQDYSILISKSVIDGVTSVTLAMALGVGVAFSVLPILLYEGGLTLLAGLLVNVLQESTITEMSAVGGCIIVGIGFNLLGLGKTTLKIGNMLPAIFLPLLYLPISAFLSQLFA